MSKVLTNEQFIQKAYLIHGTKYRYNEINYVNMKNKINITCPLHGSWLQKPENHLMGQGCPICGRLSTNIHIKNRVLSKEEFLIKANCIHKNKYNYKLDNFKSVNDNISINCNLHGRFYQKIYKHLSGQGCKKCAQYLLRKKFSRGNSKFIEQAHLVHQDRYDYSSINYINDREKVEIICYKHMSFWQSPNAHLRGQGCPICCINSISKMEVIWLDSLSIPLEKRSKILHINNKKFWVDAFDANTNTIYEFYGDFWHGNPAVFNSLKINPKSKISFGELFQKTIDREDFLKKHNYNIVSIWEFDFKLKGLKN